MVVEDAAASRSAQRSFHVPATAHVANRPIAHHVLDALEAAGVSEVVVASSARNAAAVRDCLELRAQTDRMRLQFIESESPLELASSLSLAAPIVNGAPCIVHAAGGLLAESLGSLVECLTDGADAVVTVHRTPPPDQQLSAVAMRMLDLQDPDVGQSALGVAGVLGFGPGALGRVAVGPRAEPESPPELARRIVAGGANVRARLTDAWHDYRGDSADLLELNRVVLDLVGHEPPRRNSDGNHIEGRVWIDESATVRASVLVGPLVIGPRARISDAYIGPYTAVGSGAVIEGAEIERSIISAGASVIHIGPRLTASVIGRDARVFREFSLPRSLRLNVGDGNEIGLC